MQFISFLCKLPHKDGSWKALEATVCTKGADGTIRVLYSKYREYLSVLSVGGGGGNIYFFTIEQRFLQNL